MTSEQMDADAMEHRARLVEDRMRSDSLELSILKRKIRDQRMADMVGKCFHEEDGQLIGGENCERFIFIMSEDRAYGHSLGAMVFETEGHTGEGRVYVTAYQPDELSGLKQIPACDYLTQWSRLCRAMDKRVREAIAPALIKERADVKPTE